MSNIFLNLADQISSMPEYSISGTVSGVKGMLVEVKGINAFVSVGSVCHIESRIGTTVRAEVVGFREKEALLMAFADVVGIGIGCKVSVVQVELAAYPTLDWRGRVINCFGEPIDGKGPIPKGEEQYLLKASPPPAHARRRVKDKLDMGVAAVNAFVTCCVGQRLGIFAGSGVGKSVLMAMFAKFARSDVKVIGLIGERGREVQEFIEDYLGEEGLKNAVVIVSTSDESALARRQAAYLTMAISEYFRDHNMSVLTMMDSVTRFAMALREIGLAAGEPPTSKGYTPSVFAELPKLLERAGPGSSEQGDITGIFSTLVEGDDTNEPIADAVRAILDGHIVLSRDIAARGRFPAIDVANSISRLMPGCNSDEENIIVNKARRNIALYNEISDLVRIGAYKPGTDKDVDEAIRLYPLVEQFLSQDPNRVCSLRDAYENLAKCIV